MGASLLVLCTQFSSPWGLLSFLRFGNLKKSPSIFLCLLSLSLSFEVYLFERENT